MITMQPRSFPRAYLFLMAVFVLPLFALTYSPDAHSLAEDVDGRYIVQADDLAQAVAAVAAVGGEITHELSIINSVGASLTGQQVTQLEVMAAVRNVYPDRAVAVEGFNDLYSATVPVAADGWLKQQVPGEVNASGTEVSVREVNGDSHRGVYRFDLSAIPPNALIMSATAKFWTTQASNKAVNLYRVTAAWDETNANWSNLGNAYDPTLIASYVPRKVSKFESVDLKSLTQQWVDGSLPNNGLMFVSSATNSEAKFGTRERQGANQQPYLSITYLLLPSAVDAPRVASATPLHGENRTGDNVTVAIIDTGWYDHPVLNDDTNSDMRLVAQYNAITDKMDNLNNGPANDDDHGHGSHVTSTIANSFSYNSKYFSVAPNVDLVTIKAFDSQGAGSYLDVIRAMDWVLANQSEYNIRVLNLSFTGEPQSYYWDDPLNQAVMQAWQAGIVVVAAAGNVGPDAMTIGVPGNVPYVVTVGAMSDNYTPFDPTDDILAPFSSAGPTVEAFVKPEVIAPGGMWLGSCPPKPRSV